ncbi:hypothetical protein BH10PSE16_BH10PSE16_29290 [soil metagenome]
MNLQDKVAVVTGGASGLGRAVVVTLLAGDARVALFDRDGERGTQAATALGSSAIFEQIDITSEAQVQAGIDATLARFWRYPHLYQLRRRARRSQDRFRRKTLCPWHCETR